MLQNVDSGASVRGWIALGISLAALAQVWAIAAWKRFVRRGTLHTHESGNLEIGFSTFGPTVGLLGTLRSIHQAVFVEGMEVRIIRLRDSAQRCLRWRAFRSNSVNAPGTTGAIDLARSFLVQPTAPYNYNIVFADQEFEAEFRARLNEVGDRWRAFVSAESEKSSPPLDVERILQDNTASQPLFSAFFEQEFARLLHVDVQERFFWHSGDYELALDIAVSRPSRALTTRWRFQLSDKDSKALRTNCVGIFRDLAGFRAYYHFAYPQYLKPNAPAPSAP